MVWGLGVRANANPPKETTTMGIEDDRAIRALLAMCEIIVECVEAAGDRGVPEGWLYAGMMQHGCTLSVFNDLIGALVTAGRIRKRGHLLLPGRAAQPLAEGLATSERAHSNARSWEQAKPCPGYTRPAGCGEVDDDGGDA